jgi:hypothetical protein
MGLRLDCGPKGRALTDLVKLAGEASAIWQKPRPVRLSTVDQGFLG